MKHLVLICEGMADEPMEELSGKTPLQVANTPNMDSLAARGVIGNVNFGSQEPYPSSEVTFLSLLGYERPSDIASLAALEAAGMDIPLGQKALAFRCNFVTANSSSIIDPSAGQIGEREAAILIKSLNQRFEKDTVRFYHGGRLHHLAVIPSLNEESLLDVRLSAAEKMTGKQYKRFLTKGKNRQTLLDLINRSREILEEHDVNQVRIDLKENPANMIWLSGQGRACQLVSFNQRFGLKGCIVAAQNYVKGIARLGGMDVISVPGATGHYDTNYLGKAECAVQALSDHDLVFIHINAAAEASRAGDLKQKVLAIEQFDHQVVAAIRKDLEEKERFRVLITSLQPMPLSLRMNTSSPAPYLISGDGIHADKCTLFDERKAAKSRRRVEQGHTLLRHFLSYGEEA